MDSEDDLYFTRAMVAFELDEAAQHLQDLTRRLSASSGYGDPEFRIDLGHVYAHLNRAWHRRNTSSDSPSADEFDAWSQFPTDVPPVG
ncbi:MAG TPA: hypothetical protein VGB53_02920 [Rubricoccaceae bacterium]